MAPSGASANPQVLNARIAIPDTRRSKLNAATLALLITLPAAGLPTTVAADHKSEPARERIDHSVKDSRHYSSTSPDRIEIRQDRQRRRIEKGIDHGDLTRSEARELNRQQHKIDDAKRRYARDGYLSSRENEKLIRYLDRASHRIHKYRNNGRYRGQSRRYSHNSYGTSSYYQPVPRHRSFHHGPRIFFELGHLNLRHRYGHGRKHGAGHHRGKRRFGHHRRHGHKRHDHRKRGHRRH